MDSIIKTLSISNHKILFLCLFVLFAGLSTGFFFEFIMPDADKLYLEEALSYSLDSSKFTLLPLLLTNLVLLALILLAGLSVYGFPLILILLFFKTMTFGFCLPLLSAVTSPQAVFFMILTPNIILTAVFLITAALSLNYAISHIRNKK